MQELAEQMYCMDGCVVVVFQLFHIEWVDKVWQSLQCNSLGDYIEPVLSCDSALANAFIQFNDGVEMH